MAANALGEIQQKQADLRREICEAHSLLYRTNILRSLIVLAEFMLAFNALNRQKRLGFLSKVQRQDHKKGLEYADDFISFLRNTNRELDDLLYERKWLDDGQAQKPSPGTSRFCKRLMLHGADAGSRIPVFS